MSEDDGETKQPGLNPLFLGVVLALGVGGVAAAGAGGEELLRSNVVFRFAVGGIAALIVYIAVVALWLAWHRKPFKKMSVGNTGIATDDDAREDLTQRDLEVAEFMGTTTKALEELGRRVEELEQKRA